MQHGCNLAAQESGLECAGVNNDDFTVLVSGGGRCCWVSMCTVWPSHSKWRSRATNLHQILRQAWTFLHGNYSYDSEGCSYGQLVIDSFIATTSQLTHHVSCQVLLRHQITQVTQPHCRPHLSSCDFWLFPKLQSPLKRKRFQTISEIQENMTGQLMATGRTVWGPRVPTLEGTEALMSYVQCFLYLLQ